jgi:hypothetical protein
MKSRFRQPWFLLAACFLLLVAISFAANGFPVLGQTEIAHRPQKNPKLSTPLSLLSRNVKQETARPAAAEAIKPPSGFAVETLPKQLRDAVHAGQMHVTNNGEVQVYIEMTAIDQQNLDELRSYGVTVQIIGNSKPDKSKGEVLTRVPTVQGLLPVTMINQISALPFVRYIRLPDYGFTNTGSVESQGDALLQAVAARSQFGVDGTGIRVGVISNGIGGIFATGCTSCGPTTAIPSPITSGDLPSATGTRNSTGVLTSVSGGIIAQSFPSSSPNLEPPATDTASGVGSEGTAMLEIVHDLAPGATLYFANASDGASLSFEQAVNYLATNTDVVVDDLGFFDTPFDGTSVVSTNTATALNTDSNPIRGYFTAVDNFAQDHYEGQYVDSGVDGTSITGEAGHLHIFQAVANITTDNGGFGPSIADPLEVPANSIVRVFLAWNDPNGASTNDYDLFLVPLNCPNGFSATLPLPPCTISGAPVGLSTDSQTGTQKPTELALYQNSTNSPVALGIVIQDVGNAAAARTFDVFILSTLSDGANPAHNFNTVSGSVPAEGDAGGSPVSVVSVGAIGQSQCSSPGNCTGSVEPYSSQGPTEATPQATARMKPDVTATDGVSVTGAGGFGVNPSTGTSPCPTGTTPCTFFGSSAAAPHAAAVAAITLQAAHCLLSSSTVNTPAMARANLRNFLTSTAVPLLGISQAVPNNVEGSGLLNALAAVRATLPTPIAGANQTVNGTSSTGASVAFSGSATDPDTCPVTLSWTGSCGTASGASASLMCPIGAGTETLTASNGGVTTALPTSTVQIIVSDFTVASTQPSASVSAGQPASYTMNVGSSFGAFTNAVTLACSGLPSLASCSFSPATATPGSGSTTSTLTISTVMPSSVFPISWPKSPPAPIFVLWFGLLFALGFTVIITKKSGRKRAAAFTFGLLIFCVASALVACGGGGSSVTHNPGTPTGTFPVTVTGSSNQLQHSTTVTLSVH